VLEIVRPHSEPVNPRVAIFDFDGTLSLIRSGWMPMMISMFLDQLHPLEISQSESELQSHLENLVHQLTGKETIYQMSALADEVAKHGGAPLAAEDYKAMFLDRLLRVVDTRLEALHQGVVDKDQLLVPGSRALLETLREQGCTLFLASGTDEPNVKEEAAALDISKYFEDRIYGARNDDKGFTKAELVRHLLAEAGYTSQQLIGFGDGPVEIREVSQAGSLAIGVATDEPDCTRIDEGKRRHLIAAGATFVIPNYREIADLIDIIFPQRVPAFNSAIPK
jgi:phosphoglycolate phosphatase